jgi:transcriptional regulator with XRE-family HTH domain
MNTRIAQIRKSQKINQDEFARRLGLTKNFISLIETGGRSPSERTILDICREFNVNEYWLRTGEGEMFRVKSRKEEMAEFMAKLVGGELDPFYTKLINVLAQLDSDQIALLADIVSKMVEEEQKEKADQ